MKLIAIISIAFLLFPCLVRAQDSISDQIKYIRYIENNAAKYERKVDQYSQRMLARFSKQERRIKNKLDKIDPQKAAELFDNKTHFYSDKVRERIMSKVPASAHLDTVQLSLNYLQKAGWAKPYIDQATQNQEALQGKLKITEDIQSYIQGRRRQLQAQLVQYTQFSKNIHELSKQAYYYNQQLQEYKSLYENPSKIERKALTELKKLPAYNAFIKNNSLLAGLFNLGEDYNNSRNLYGLQGRTQVEALVQSRLGTDAGSRAAISEQMAQAKEKLSELKNKYPDLNNPAAMPDFKPNPMKSKPFLKRLEPGGNIQFQKNNSYYPTTTDIAGQIGYKFTKNGSIGVGISYKLGLGNGWNHISFSHQGLGLRSYFDWKLKGSIYMNGGFEKNYLTAATPASQSINLSGWKNSGLLGISKKYKVSQKVKGNIMVLYDFLATKNFPNTQAIKLRFGYTRN